MANAAKSERKVRAFDNPLLERLSRCHPALPAMLWGPVSALLLALGLRSGLGPLAVLGLGMTGVLAWTLTEYLLHRWVFHWQPADPRLRRLVYPVHQLHHDVQEWDRLVAPPLMSVPLALVLFAAARAIVPPPSVYPLFGGFILGYLGYDYIHLYTHFARPRTRLGKGLRRRHLQHHFARHDRWYGVSSPLWDYVFRTHLPGRAAQSTTR
jgi:sterol desaturase/sphingolipid hydroxylase (fatty acid hydroxylase superfamily)